MLQVFYPNVAHILQWFSGVFASVSDARSKYFIYLETYIASVASGCFKSRSSVASRSPPHLRLPRLGVSTFSQRWLGIRTRGVGGRRPLPFFLMLAVRLDVSKVDLVLHLAPLLAFGCLASVSPPSLSASWASEPEAQMGATPSPSS
jgi:hypothetical protein